MLIYNVTYNKIYVLKEKEEKKSWCVRVYVDINKKKKGQTRKRETTKKNKSDISKGNFHTFPIIVAGFILFALFFRLSEERKRNPCKGYDCTSKLVLIFVQTIETLFEMKTRNVRLNFSLKH